MLRRLALFLVLALSAGVVQAEAFHSERAVYNRSLPADSQGINCKGSRRCAIKGENSGALRQLVAMSTFIDPKRHYNNGERIACVKHHICVFLQKTPHGISGDRVRRLLPVLRAWGCRICGSIPIGYLEGTNNNEDGELTVNYTRDESMDCCGLCDGEDWHHNFHCPEIW